MCNICQWYMINDFWSFIVSILLPGNYNPFSIEYKGVLSSCVEHFFIASTFTFETVNLATVTIGAMVMRFDRVAVLISSYQCRISPRFHVETALLGVTNLQIKHVKWDFNAAEEDNNRYIIDKLLIENLLPDCNLSKAHFQNNVASWYHWDKSDTTECIAGWILDTHLETPWFDCVRIACTMGNNQECTIELNLYLYKMYISRQYSNKI